MHSADREDSAQRESARSQLPFESVRDGARNAGQALCMSVCSTRALIFVQVNTDYFHLSTAACSAYTTASFPKLHSENDRYLQNN